MKKLFYFFSIVILFSCQKEKKDDGNQSLTELNLTDVSYGTNSSQKMDLYLPAGRTTDSTKLIVLIHGGAWVQDDKSFFNGYLPKLKEKLPNYAIANINYRLATANSNHFPAQENDVKAAIDYLVQKIPDYKISQKIVLLGVSAGGHLAMLQAYKYPSTKIEAVVDLFGPVDMSDLYNTQIDPFNKLALQTILGGTPTTNPTLYQQSSPINFVSAQSPPTLIFHGTADDYVNISQSQALKAKLQSFGVINELVIYQGEGHGWAGARMDDSFNRMEAFLKAHVR